MVPVHVFLCIAVSANPPTTAAIYFCLKNLYLAFVPAKENVVLTNSTGKAGAKMRENTLVWQISATLDCLIGLVPPT